ncbi:hypothetical protein RO21_11655 [[Actinobacillus] muris]|uniref:Transferrin-binding protein B C-lobe/N-lobe beta barrel domain-containing protein n=1 Tax=Muribacter muris TaxID=67855 RepID=A0A0J5P2H9_9PAST|nr:hypothetical protein [Muribacter muris]KMK50466.1 hypothetical protein RO21_11655 [[Actinobacillus] muris] [Muribacter muris]
MKKSKLAVVIIGAFILSACGGGGSGGSSNPSSSKINKPVNDLVENPKKEDDTKNKVQDKPREPDTIFGNYVFGVSTKDSGITSISISGKDLNTLDIWGKSIPLADPAVVAKDGWKAVGFNGIGVVNDETLLS